MPFEDRQFGPKVGFSGTLTRHPFQADFEEKRTRSGGQDADVDLIQGSIRRDDSGRVRTDYKIEMAAGYRLDFSSIVDPLAKTHILLDHARQVLVLVEDLPVDGGGTWLYPDGTSLEIEEESECPGAADYRCRRVLIDLDAGEKRGRIESWTCEELKQVVFERVRTAESVSVYRLFNIRREPPDIEAFQIPPNYVSFDERH